MHNIQSLKTEENLQLFSFILRTLNTLNLYLLLQPIIRSIPIKPAWKSDLQKKYNKCFKKSYWKFLKIILKFKKSH